MQFRSPPLKGFIMKKSSLLIILLIVFTVVLLAQQKPIVKAQSVKPTEQSEAPSGKFVGTLFNDALYILQEPQSLNSAKGTAGKNAFLFRRATIGYAYSINKNVSSLIEYDAANKLLEQGFVDVKNLMPSIDVKIGLMQTLSSELNYKMWDYRSLEASALDRKGFTDEFDMGLTITGRIDARGNSYARLAVYNGNGLVAENDKLKKIAFAAGNWFDKYSVLEAYVDYENLLGGKSIINTKLFFGTTSTKFSFGLEGFYRLERKALSAGGDKNPVGGSLFSWFEMTKSVRGVARIDAIDDDVANTSATLASPSYREIYLNIGIDYLPAIDVHLIPNFVFIKQMKKGTSKEIADRMEARLTTAITIK